MARNPDWKPPPKDPHTGQFMPRDPGRRKLNEHRKRAASISARAGANHPHVAAVEQRALDRVAERGLKSGHRRISEKQRSKVTRTFDALVVELGGDDAPMSTVLMAERVARRRAELEYLDGVMAEYRRRGKLVDRKNHALRRIQEQYGELQSEYRADLVAFNQMKSNAQLDEIHRELDELKRLASARTVNTRPPIPGEEY